MNRSRLLSTLVYGLIILGLASAKSQLLILAIPFVLYMGAGLVFGPESIQLQARRSLSSDRVLRGGPVTIKAWVTNEGPPLEHLLLENIIPHGLKLVDGEARTLVSLKTGDSVEMEYTVSGQRGYYRLPGIRATANDHLGLIRKQAQLELSNHLFVLPRVHKLPQVAIRPRRTRVFPGLISARKGGPGVEFYGVREYQPGDSLRWINHRASVRFQNTLFVNEFEQERAVDVGLILDTRKVTNLFTHNQSLLEYTIEATATLADSFLSHGNRVGLLIYGGYENWTFPGYGKIHRERILQALATAQLRESMVFQELDLLPTRLFPSRSQLVLISSLRRQDLNHLVSLRARGYRLLIISPDPVDFEARQMGAGNNVALAVRIARLEREYLFRQLRQAGAQVFEWQVDDPFHQVAQNALSRVPLWARGPGAR